MNTSQKIYSKNYATQNRKQTIYMCINEFDKLNFEIF